MVVLATVVGAVVPVVLAAVLVIGAVVLATVVGAVVPVVLAAVLVIVLVVGAATEEVAPVALAGDELSADALAVQIELAATAKRLTATAKRSLKPAIRIL